VAILIRVDEKGTKKRDMQLLKNARLLYKKNGFLSCSPVEHHHQHHRKVFIDLSSSAEYGFGRTRESIVHSGLVRYV